MCNILIAGIVLCNEIILCILLSLGKNFDKLFILIIYFYSFRGCADYYNFSFKNWSGCIHTLKNFLILICNIELIINYIFIMYKVFVAFGIALLLTTVVSLGVSPCPIQSNFGSLISGTGLFYFSTHHCSPATKSCNSCTRYWYSML